MEYLYEKFNIINVQNENQKHFKVIEDKHRDAVETYDKMLDDLRIKCAYLEKERNDKSLRAESLLKELKDSEKNLDVEYKDKEHLFGDLEKQRLQSVERNLEIQDLEAKLEMKNHEIERLLREKQIYGYESIKGANDAKYGSEVNRENSKVVNDARYSSIDLNSKIINDARYSNIDFNSKITSDARYTPEYERKGANDIRDLN